MSIIICNLCQHQIDSDFVDCNEYEGKEVCQECFEQKEGDKLGNPYSKIMIKDNKQFFMAEVI